MTMTILAFIFGVWFGGSTVGGFWVYFAFCRPGQARNGNGVR